MFAKRTVIFLCCCILWVCFSSCSLRAIKEAEAVVAQADSLWRNGRRYTDSLSLAQAYNTLHQLPIINHHSTSYAHACYHYGRLLRDHDDPVSAMQVFINASHSRTHDYHILGRVYSNMGSICHLANEFQLSYDMYSRSANMFLRNGDTINYYYGLNNMAYELAEQGMAEETLVMLSIIKENCLDTNVIAKAFETKAKLYFQTGQYDSVISVVNKLQTLGHIQSTSYVLKARAYWHIGNADSALYYAKFVLALPHASEQEKYNMFYILINGDSTLSNEQVIEISAQRSDIETDILIPLHNKMAVAVELLQQDLESKPDLWWLYSIVATLVIVGVGLSIYVLRKRKKQELLSQQINILKQATSTIQEKHNELSNRYQNEQQRIENEIKEKCTLLLNDANIKKTLSWKDFDLMCSIIDQQFYLFASKLRAKQILNEKEIRLCVLVLIGFSRFKIPDILPYSQNSVGKLKDQTAKLLGTTGKKLQDFLLKLVIGP